MKGIGIITLVAVLALGALGVGYASWSKTLTTTVTVNTGTFGVQIENVVSNDPSGTHDPAAAGTWSLSSAPYSWTGSTMSQDVASTNATLNADGDTLTITLGNVYPGYYGSVACDVLNTGSIPVKVTATQGAVTPAGNANARATDIAVTYSGVFNETGGHQINAGAKETGYITVGVGTEGGASTEPPQVASGAGSTYSFTVTVSAAQVN